MPGIFRSIFGGSDHGSDSVGAKVDPEIGTPRKGSVPSVDRRPELDGKALFEALIARAIEAQTDSAGQRAGFRPTLPPDLIAAGVKRLSDPERAAILAYFSTLAATNASPRTWPHDQGDLGNTFKALIDTIEVIAPETATHLFTIYWHYCFVIRLYGLKKMLSRMEHAGRETYAGHPGLMEGYATFRRRHQSLNPSRVESDEMTDRFESLLGIAAPPKAADAPQSRPAAGQSADLLTLHRASADETVVEDYLDAVGTLTTELRAWIDAIGAADPAFHETAVAAWETAHGLKGVRYDTKAVPIKCYAVLESPPPQWLLDADEIFASSPPYQDGMASAGNFYLSTIRHLTFHRFRVFDRAWFEANREAALQVAGSLPVFDWSGTEIVERDSLRLPAGPHSDALFDLLWQARSATPAKAWIKSAERLLASADRPAAMDAVRHWLALIPLPGKLPSPEISRRGRFHVAYCDRVRIRVSRFGDARRAAIADICGEWSMCWGSTEEKFTAPDYGIEHPALLSEENELILRGAVWLLSFESTNVDLLQSTALALLERVPRSGVGANYRSLMGVNASVWALGRIATAEAVTALGRIRLKVRDERLSKQIAKAMVIAAGQAGLTIEELEEISVPGYDLDRNGTCTVDLAGHAATLAVETSTDVALTIRRPDGKIAKGVPTAIKVDTDAKTALKALQATAKEIEHALPVHRTRLERSWLTGRTWSGAEFRAHFIDHPLMGWFASRLVWTVTPAGGGVARSMHFLAGKPVHWDDRPTQPLAEDDRIALWHPMAADVETVRGWRAFLMLHRITQPIKQAHRETYALTDAERHTSVYSNRFAGHIIRQHQSAALARLRGWSCRLRISADIPNDDPTHIKIPAFGLAAEYWTEAAGGDEPEFTEGLAYVFLKTDQIRFRRLTDDGDWRRDGGRGFRLGPHVPLTDVTAVVFSEVMRDIDLFVGVASIGHDPTWIDAGADALHPNQWRRDAAREYWNSFNAAELAESAKSRHAFLAELLPKLTIAPQCSLDERFLIVRGTFRTYRIHIGSGNIFMEPDNRYLCIVLKGNAEPVKGSIFLPFEGDRLLSVILSKAFLLARDDAITDQTILRYIR